MLQKYLLQPEHFYSFHIMLTNYCNSRCTYCQQFTEYDSQQIALSDFKKLIDFIRNGTFSSKRQILLEGGEPTFYTYLEEALEYLFSLGEQVVLLSNGRIPVEKYHLISKYLENNTIKHIGLHVPVGKEPFYKIRNLEIERFLAYLFQRKIEKKIIFLGLLYSKNIPYEDIVKIVFYGKQYSELCKGVSFCYPHPSLLGRHHINFEDRVELSSSIIKLHLYMMKHNIQPILDGTLACILEAGLKNLNIDSPLFYESIFSQSVDISSNHEIHIDTLLKANIISSLAENSYIISRNVLEYDSPEVFFQEINTSITELYDKNFSLLPEECTSCKFFLKGCSGDHFKLISRKISHES